MPGAIMVANQPTGAGSGTPGVARNDLWQTRPIDLLDAAGGNSAWSWTLLDKPPGSAATLSTPTTSTSGFTPDLIGTYRVQLVTNSGGPGNIQIRVFRVRKDSAGVLAKRGWALPAIGELEGENNYPGNARSWAEVFEFIFEDLRTVAERTLVPLRTVYPLFAGIQSTQVTVAEDLGVIAFDPSAMAVANTVLTRSIKFAAVLEVTTGVTAEIHIYNLSTGQVLTGSTLTSTTTSPTRVVSAGLTIGASPNMPNSLQLYVAKLRISNPGSPGPSDFAICKGAQFEVSYT